MQTQYQIKSYSNLWKTIAILTMSFLCVRNGQSQRILGESEHDIGVRGTSNSSYGVRGESYSAAGVYGESYSAVGVFGTSSSSAGVTGVSSSFFGLRGVSFDYHGAYFRGNKEGGFADIVLGTSSLTNTGDDGVISSDPDYPGSDIFLKSNDAVIIELDDNGSEEGEFEIRNDDDQKILVMLESGQFEVWNGAATNDRRLLLEPDGDLIIDGTLTQGSDINRKENITTLAYQQILQAIKDMPIYEWQYKGQGRRHIGPMAQDFHKAFNLGDDDKSIAAIDADGVALAAIKAQQEIIEDQERRIAQHESEISTLKQEIAQLKSLMISDLRKTD